MDIVDSQVHFNLLGDLEAGIAAMDAVGVKSLVYDEFWGFDEKSRILPGYELPNGAFRYTFPAGRNRRHEVSPTALPTWSASTGTTPNSITLSGQSARCRDE